MAQGSSQFTKPCLPPGLEGSDPTPAKIQVGDTLKLLASGGNVPDAAVLSYTPEIATQGEWVNAVMATAPYLDAQGLQQALGILDCAIVNVKQAKALDAIIAAARGSAEANLDKVAPASLHEVYAAEAMRAQICQQQQVLLQQLHCLRGTANLLNAAPVARVPPAMSRDGKPKPTVVAESQPPSYDGGGGTNISIAERVLGALGHPLEPQRGAGLHQRVAARNHGGAAGAAAAPGGAAARQPNQKQGADRSSRGSGRQAQTLSTSLQLLVNEDPDCLFIVRRINKLGFKACRKLKQHFSSYGTVVRVLVAHSTVRQHGDPQCNTRRRPSSLGFVQMAATEAVKAILAKGSEQEVDGSVIRVQRFERQPNGHDEEEEDIEDEVGTEAQALNNGRDGLTKDSDWNRQHSAYSSVSTRTAASTAVSLESDVAVSEE